MSHLNWAEVIKAKLEEEKQINIILKSLPNSFNQFKINYNMNKLKLTHTQLMHELKSVEQSLVKPINVHLAKGYVKPRGKPQGDNKNKKKKVVVLVSKLTAMKKSKDKCFKCGQKGH